MKTELTRLRAIPFALYAAFRLGVRTGPEFALLRARHGMPPR